jgi:hypothetical protein
MSESEMFSGDISDFPQFLNRYDGLMKNVRDPQVKLNYLLICTKKKAHKSIRHFDMVFHGDHERAFEEAMKTLKFRFGTASKIANKTTAEIFEGKVIKTHSKDDFWSLIIELRICDAVSRGKERMTHDFWSPEKIRKIVRKRCPFLEARWSRMAYKIEKAGREATFEEFLELLMDQAMEIGSSYGKSSYEDQEEKKSKPDRAFKPDHNTGYNKPVPKGSWAAEVKPQAQAGGPSSPWKSVDPVTAVIQETMDTLNVRYSNPKHPKNVSS